MGAYPSPWGRVRRSGARACARRLEVVGVVIWELVKEALDLLGVHGQFAVALAALVVGGYYAREFSGLLRGVARWTWLVAVIGVLVGMLLVGGLATGVLDVNGSMIGQLAEMLLEGLGGI